MMDVNNVKMQYDDLSKKIHDLSIEEEVHQDEYSSLVDEYNLCKKAYYDSVEIYNKVNRRFEDKKYKYVSKNHLRHINLVMLITLIISLCGSSIIDFFGLVGDKFLLYLCACIPAIAAGAIDIHLFWDKMIKKYGDKFDALESTKYLQDTLDNLYVQKSKNEKDMNDAYDKVCEHSKLLKEISNKKYKFNEEISSLKVKLLEEILGSENNLVDDMQLVLK